MAGSGHANSSITEKEQLLTKVNSGLQIVMHVSRIHSYGRWILFQAPNNMGVVRVRGKKPAVLLRLVLGSYPN